MLQIHFLPLGAYQTNCYLVWDDASSQCIVIDPGYTPEKVLAEAEKLGKSVAAVLLTHGHFDHVGGVKGIADKTGCPVYLHEKELSLPEEMTAGPLCYTHTYGQGDTLSLAGLTIEVLHTPGIPPARCVCRQRTPCSPATPYLWIPAAGRISPAAVWRRCSAPCSDWLPWRGTLPCIPATARPPNSPKSGNTIPICHNLYVLARASTTRQSHPPCHCEGVSDAATSPSLSLRGRQRRGNLTLLVIARA